MKKSLVLLLALTLGAFAGARYVRAEDNSAIETKLKQMEDTWEKAIVSKDATAIGNMVAEDFAGISHNGEHQNKSQLLDHLKTNPDTLSAATNDKMEVHVYAPNLATVVGTSIEKGKDKDGKEFTHTYGWVDVWMERNGKWQCISEGVAQVPEKK